MPTNVTTARRNFTDSFGPDTVNVVKAIVHGWSNDRIATKLDIPTMSVAAYRANLTRGAYSPFVRVLKSGNFSGSCKY